MRGREASPEGTKENDMRVMVIIKANPQTESESYAPDVMQKMLTEMGNYNEELVKAGLMLAAEGLHPSSKGKRVRFSGDSRTVVDGPFTEAKELVAGFWIWRVASMDEAVEWVKRCPNPTGGESEIEIRTIGEPEEFGAELTPEARAKGERVRAEAEKLAKKKG
jgi:hypothetical protein